MPVTLAAARERVRLRLEDTGASPIWSQDEIDAGLAQALDEYSHHYPDELRTEASVAQGDMSITLPEGARQVVRVTYPSGWVVPPQTIPLRSNSSSEQAWEVWGNQIEFNRRLPAGNFEIRYLGPRQFPNDGAAPLPVPEGDVSLLVLGAVTWCLEQRSVAEWKRGALPARYETVLRRARDEYQAAWRSRRRRVQVGRVAGTG